MENLQTQSNSQCGELERLAAAAATMDYTDAVPSIQNQSLQQNDPSMMQASPNATATQITISPSSRSSAVSSMHQVISYIEPYHFQKGHLIPLRGYETQAYVHEQSQPFQSLVGSRVVVLATNNSHPTAGVQFTRPVTRFASPGVQYHSNLRGNESHMQPSTYSTSEVLCSPNTPVIHYAGPTNQSFQVSHHVPNTISFEHESSEAPEKNVISSIKENGVSEGSKNEQARDAKCEREEGNVAENESTYLSVPFPCNICQIVFESEEAFKQHQLEHNVPKRNGLALEVKIEIIKRINSGERKADMADEYGVNTSTIKSIMKKADSYLSCWKKGMFNPESKRLKGPKREDIEEALYSWYKQAIENDTPVSGPILCSKAMDFAKKLGHADFKTTHGWLDRFKKRKKIVFGRSASKRRREEKPHESISSVLPQMLIDYEATDIFSVELFGLFYRALPSASDLLKSNKCSGGVRARERLTVVLCTNMTGSEKFPMLIVGWSRRNVAINTVRTLPLHYMVNENAWLTPEIISSWLLDIDSWFVQQGRKVTLLASPLPIYSHPPKLRAVKLALIPSGYPAPLRQIVIPYLKRVYRKNFLKELMTVMSNGKKLSKNSFAHLPLINCLQIISSAWQGLTENVIVSSFQRAGLTKFGLWGMMSPDESAELTGMQDVFMSAIHALDDISSTEITFENYIHFDDEIQVCNLMGDDDILAKVKGLQEEEEDLSEEEYNKENATQANCPNAKPSFSEVEKALAGLRRYIQYQEGAQEMFQVLARLEYCIFKRVHDPSIINPVIH